jgi:hypothetical protein
MSTSAGSTLEVIELDTSPDEPEEPLPAAAPELPDSLDSPPGPNSSPPEPEAPPPSPPEPAVGPDAPYRGEAPKGPNNVLDVALRDVLDTPHTK